MRFVGKDWFYKLYTKDCNACKALELGEPRKGKAHSAACCANYVRWLEEQRMLDSKDSSIGVGGEEPLKQWFDDHGLFISECPACSALELGMSLDGVKHSDECRSNFTRWKAMNEFEALKYLDVSHELHGGADDELRRSVREGSYTPEFVGLEPGDTGVDRHVHFDVSSPGDAGGGKDSSAEIRVRKRPIEEGFPSVDDGMIVDKDPSEYTVIVDSDGTRSMSRGSKRLLDDVPEDADP